MQVSSATGFFDGVTHITVSFPLPPFSMSEMSSPYTVVTHRRALAGLPNMNLLLWDISEVGPFFDAVLTIQLA